MLRLVTSYRGLSILLLVLNMLSAATFIVVVPRPVYDDAPNFVDASRYAREGITVQSIRSHVNPTGPTSFIWMAAGVRLLGGNELRAARIAVLTSWLLLSGGILLAAHSCGSSQLWYAALFTTLVFPHTMTATGTLMTEGPALMAATLGAFAWTASMAVPRMTAKGVTLALLGGVALGLAVTCRQYYLALLPAAALVALLQLRHRPAENRSTWIHTVIGSLLFAATPIVILMLAWKGLSSPSMATGASYQQWRAAAGLNLIRPLIASLYIGIYLMLLTFPSPFRSRFARRWVTLTCALAAGVGIAIFRERLVQPGPLHSLGKIAGVLWHGEFLLVGIVAALAFYNSVAFVVLLWEKRAILSVNPLVLFSMFVVMFFVLEQLGVGGNIPFYDRYVLQLAPFLGIVVFHALPGLKAPRLITFALLAILSHSLLWRNAF